MNRSVDRLRKRLRHLQNLVVERGGFVVLVHRIDGGHELRHVADVVRFDEP